MKETLKDVLLMGLGALSLTGEKAMELKNELLEKGTHMYQEGTIKNEELKRDIKEKIKEKTNIRFSKATKEDLVEILSTMDEKELEELFESVKKNEEKCACEDCNYEKNEEDCNCECEEENCECSNSQDNNNENCCNNDCDCSEE